MLREASQSVLSPSTSTPPKKLSIPELVAAGILCALVGGCMTGGQPVASGDVTGAVALQPPEPGRAARSAGRAPARRTSVSVADAPFALRAKLAQAERSVGFSAVAVSVCRPGARFRHEGGWRQSYHATCEAIDFKVVPANKKPAALAWFRHNHNGYVINYPNGQCGHCTHIHIDTGSHGVAEDVGPRFPIARVDP